MSTTDDIQHRQHYNPDPSRVTVREDTGEDGLFAVRMPIASTGEVRNEGDDPLSRDELDGMADQLQARQIGVFPEHGKETTISRESYSQLEKMGYWADAEVEDDASADDEDLLVADAMMPDPETLPEETGAYRQALAIYKEQANRGIALSSSIGWRQDDDYPGGNDLLEASIVGIGADPRTDSVQGSPTEVLARAAVDAGADPETFVEEVRAVVLEPDNEGSDARDSVTDDDTDQSGGEPDDTNDESDDIPAEEFRSEMIEMQRQQTETLSALADALREDGDGDDGGDEDDEDDDGDADDENEGDHDDGDDEDDDDDQSADEPDDTQSLTVDGDDVTADDIREMQEQLADARENGDIETPGDADDDQDGDGTEQRDSDSDPDDTNTADSGGWLK